MLRRCVTLVATALLSGLGWSAVGMAQSASVTGRVIDAETGDPLAGVHVFLDQTTLGSTTTDGGVFHISAVPPGEHRVVASMVGYGTQVEHIEVVPETGEYHVDFELIQSIVELVGIEVETDRPRNWERDLRLFERRFVGSTSNAEMTEIVNPYVLDFQTVEGRFTATAPVPLQITNRALGYRLTLELVQYRLSDEMLQMAGPVRFEELQPSSQREADAWEERRRATYAGSLMHFLRSLIEGSLRAEGFYAEHELHLGYNVERVPLGTFPILEVTERPYLYRLFFDHELVVAYGREASRLRLSGDEALIHSGGYVYGSSRGEPPLTVSGAMSADRLADVLPRDYRP